MSKYEFKDTLEEFLQTVSYSQREYRREFIKLSPPEVEILQELNRREAKRLYGENNKV